MSTIMPLERTAKESKESKVPEHLKNIKKYLPEFLIATAFAFIILYLVYTNWGFWDSSRPNPKDDELLNITFSEHTNLALHIHPFLNISIDGRPVVIPENIGITEKGMHVIHTHDETGKIHIEGPTPHQFHLKDFFAIWGKKFNQTCVLDFCENSTHTIKLYLNDIPDNRYGELPLIDRDKIKIEVKAK